MGKLSGRVAIVTGGASGIGYGIAELFGREGATVVIGELVAERGEQAAGQLRATGYRAEAIPLDVTRLDSCHHVTRRVLETCGRVDILVNNAGLFFLDKSEDTPEDHWRLQIDVMLNGAFGPRLSRSSSHRRACRNFVPGCSSS